MDRPNNEELLRIAHGILIDNGFVLDGPVLADGTRHYCNTSEKPRGHKASYTVHLGVRPRVRLKWHYRSEPDDWKVVPLCDAGPLSPEQEAAYRAERARAQAMRAQEAEAAAEQARDRLRRWCVPASGEVPYLKAKKLLPVPNLWTMRHGGTLVVPARNAKGEVRLLQYIWYDRRARQFTKVFTRGCSPQGCSFEIEGRGEYTFLCEGLADGISIHQATGCRVIVAFNCGNLLPVAQALIAAGRLDGARTVIVCDNDWAHKPREDGTPCNPGIQHGVAAARAIGALICVPVRDGEKAEGVLLMKDADDVRRKLGADVLAARLREVEYPPEPQPDDAPPPPMDPDMFPDPDIDAMPEYMDMMDGPAEGPEQEPLPLRRPAPLQADYPVEAFGELAGAVEVLASQCYVHPSVAGIVVLCSLSLLAQRLFNVKSRLYTTPLSLYGLPVMESGGGKDVVEGLALRVVEEWEREQEKEYEAKRTEYQLKEKAYQKSLRLLEKRHTGAGSTFDPKGYADDLRVLEASRDPAPIQPLLTSDDLNVEGLYRLLKEGMPSHGIFGTEGGVLFGGLAFQQENRMRSQGVLCGVWSKGEMRKLRMVEGLSMLRDRRVCLCLLMQPSVAEKLLGDVEMVTQGFLPRCLLTWPAPMSRDVADVDVASLPEMQPYYDACRALLDLKPPQDDRPGEGLDLRPLSLSGEVFHAYRAFYRELEKAILPGERYEPIRAYARRGAEQAVRIAGVLTAAWAPFSADVPAEAMEAGIRLARWHLDEALRVTLCEAEPPKIKAADTLLRWLWSKGHGVTSTLQVLRYGPGSLRTKEAVDEAMATLVEHGWLKPAGPGFVPMGDGGKTARAKRSYRVVAGHE